MHQAIPIVSLHKSKKKRDAYTPPKLLIQLLDADSGCKERAHETSRLLEASFPPGASREVRIKYLLVASLAGLSRGDIRHLRQGLDC